MHPLRTSVSLRSNGDVRNYVCGCSTARIFMGAILVVTAIWVLHFAGKGQHLGEPMLVQDEYIPVSDDAETGKLMQTKWQGAKQKSTNMGNSRTNKEKKFQTGGDGKNRLSVAENITTDDESNDEQIYNADNGNLFENSGLREKKMNEAIDAGKPGRGDFVHQQATDVYKGNQMQEAERIPEAVDEQESSETQIERTSYRGDDNKDGADKINSVENTPQRPSSPNAKDVLSDNDNKDDVPEEQVIDMQNDAPNPKHNKNRENFRNPDEASKQPNPKSDTDGKEDADGHKHTTDEDNAISKDLSANEQALETAKAASAVLPFCKRLVLLTDPRHGSTWLLNAVENCLFSASPKQIERGIMFAHNTFLRTEIWHHLGKDMTAEDVANYASTENSVKIFCYFYKLRQPEARKLLRRQQQDGLVFVVLKRDPERAFRSRLRANRGPDISWRMRGDFEGELTNEENAKLERYKQQAQKCYTIYENDLRETGAKFDILQYEDIVRRKEIVLSNSGCRIIDKC